MKRGCSTRFGSESNRHEASSILECVRTVYVSVTVKSNCFEERPGKGALFGCAKTANAQKRLMAASVNDVHTVAIQAFYLDV